MINGVGDKADVRGTRNLRGDPQPQQQDRLNQHAEHRLAAGTDAGKRATGVQARNRKEEAGDGEEVDKGNQIAKHGQGRSHRHHRQRGGDGEHHAHHHKRRQAEDPACGIRGHALARKQLEEIAVLLQYARPTTVVHPGARHARDARQQRRGGEQHQRLKNCQ